MHKLSKFIFHRNLLCIAGMGSVLAAGGEARAAVVFDAVSAGDMTASEAILWTRADNGGAATALTVQIATDAAFSNIVSNLAGSTVASNDYTMKVDAAGLAANTHYYYRFSDGTTTSMVGQFNTTPTADQLVPFKIGFSGDADAKFRPYTIMNNFGTAGNAGSQGLNAFIFLGDTIYERNALGSPAVPGLNATSQAADAEITLAALNRKYLENISGVTSSGTMTASGQQSLQSMLAATGSYTVIDNHEIFGSLQSGGAPWTAVKENTDPSVAVNNTGTYNNQTLGFLTETKAFYNSHATAADIQGTPTTGLTITNLLEPTPAVVAPSDGRTNGTAQNYFTRSWGKAALYIQLDDRSYRDARMVDPAPNPLTPWLPSDAVNNDPNRTMLGSTQLQWFKDQLLAAKAAGSIWTVISVSTPIDQWGSEQDSKSWAGGYTAERNAILKFIADNQIDHVIFLTTDDHEMRVTQLRYQPDPINHPEIWATVPGAFQILGGPMGAGKPDSFLDHSFDAILAKTVEKNADLAISGDPLIGLAGFRGLADVYRAGDVNAATTPSSVDFYAPDQFGYSTLAFDAWGNLTVQNWGVDSYQADTYPDPSIAPSLILSFSIDVPEPGSISLVGMGLLGLLLIRCRKGHPATV